MLAAMGCTLLEKRRTTAFLVDGNPKRAGKFGATLAATIGPKNISWIME
jgi:hypothetical protein